MHPYSFSQSVCYHCVVPIQIVRQDETPASCGGLEMNTGRSSKHSIRKQAVTHHLPSSVYVFKKKVKVNHNPQRSFCRSLDLESRTTPTDAKEELKKKKGSWFICSMRDGNL